MSMEITKLVGGLDIGNGYVKGKFRGNNDVVSILDLPSAVAIDNNPNDIPVPENEIDEVISGSQTFRQKRYEVRQNN